MAEGGGVMSARVSGRGWALRGIAGFGLAVALGGCSMAGLLGGGGAPSPDQFASASSEQVAANASSAMPVIATECPPIKVRTGGEALFYFGNGKAGNPRDLHYQAIIDNQSRNCVVSNGLITVKMGMVGRVLLGPKGTETSINIPVRFAVERDGVAVYSQKFDLPVAIDAATQTADFSKVVENVGIPYLGGEDITIWVGFDPRS
jgi:hypothetical protein